MSNNRALMVVEAAQPPRIAAISSVSQDEIEYQKVSKEYRVVFEHFREAMRQRHTVRLRLTKAWLAENYPDLRCEVVSHTEERAYTALDYNIEIVIYSPIGAIILQEIKAYFAQLEA